MELHDFLIHSIEYSVHSKGYWYPISTHQLVSIFSTVGEENPKQGQTHLKRIRCGDDFPLIGATTSAIRSFCGVHGCPCFLTPADHQCLWCSHSLPFISPGLEQRTSTALEVVGCCACIRQFHLLITAPFR